MKNTMRTIILLAIIIAGCTVAVMAQNIKDLTEFTASNGVTYKEGDNIKLGRGSDTNGKFVYINATGLMMSMDAEQNRLPASFAGRLATIKKIKQYDQKKFKGVFITVGVGLAANYVLDIENAIAVCEVEICKKPEPVTVVVDKEDKYDQLKKLKGLLDEGVISQEEYDAEKKKILDKED